MDIATHSIPISGCAQYPQMVFRHEHNPCMDISQTIARNLGSWMAERADRDTIKKVSIASGVGFGTVQRARNGQGNITVQNLEAIAKAFRRSPIDLLCLPIEAYSTEAPKSSPAMQQATPVLALPEDPDIAEVAKLMRGMNVAGKARVVGFARSMADCGEFRRQGNGAW